MGIEEITQHLNKIATLYLKNHKRKVGWIFVDQESMQSHKRTEEVYFISVQKGKKYQHSLEQMDHKNLEQHCELIPINQIERIRSSK